MTNHGLNTNVNTFRRLRTGKWCVQLNGNDALDVSEGDVRRVAVTKRNGQTVQRNVTVSWTGTLNGVRVALGWPEAVRTARRSRKSWTSRRNRRTHGRQHCDCGNWSGVGSLCLSR